MVRRIATPRYGGKRPEIATFQEQARRPAAPVVDQAENTKAAGRQGLRCVDGEHQSNRAEDEVTLVACLACLPMIGGVASLSSMQREAVAVGVRKARSPRLPMACWHHPSQRSAQHSTADRKAPIREGPAFGCPVITLGSRVQRPEYGIDTGNRLVNRGTLAAPGPLRRLVGLTQTRSLLRLAAQPYGFHFVGDRLALRQAVAGCRWRTGRRDMHFALIARAGMVPECPTVRPLALVDGRNRRSGTKVCGSSQRRWWAA